MVYANAAAGKRRGDYAETAVDDIADPATATAEDVAETVNAILAELRKAGVIAESA